MIECIIGLLIGILIGTLLGGVAGRANVYKALYEERLKLMQEIKEWGSEQRQ